MTQRNLKSLFKKSLRATPGRLHFAAHSHHIWPDASAAGQAQCWQDAAARADGKWGHIFQSVIPTVQKHIAGHLNLPDPRTIAFAPNTHEFVNRLLSCLPEVPHILTTDSEFHSFDRQVRRLEEDGLAIVTRISTEPFTDFPQRFAAAAAQNPHDLVFFSHVFFNSGYAVPDLAAITKAIADPRTLVVVDGYHGFMALPTDLSALSERVFYMAGGYKYAMSGEGCCFLHCPPEYGARPRDTGWFADMGSLDKDRSERVQYPTDGFRFFGATFDPSGLYRMNAVMNMLKRHNITVETIHDHVLSLQDRFLRTLAVPPGTLVTPIGTKARGHFLTYDTPQADALCHTLKDHNVITDNRGSRLRFGFGIYQNDLDVDEMNKVLAKLLPPRTFTPPAATPY